MDEHTRHDAARRQMPGNSLGLLEDFAPDNHRPGPPILKRPRLRRNRIAQLGEVADSPAASQIHQHGDGAAVDCRLAQQAHQLGEARPDVSALVLNERQHAGPHGRNAEAPGCLDVMHRFLTPYPAVCRVTTAPAIVRVDVLTRAPQ